MAATRRTLERYLIDGDDRQTARSWSLEAEAPFLVLKRITDGDELLRIKLSDVDQFCTDLKELQRLSAEVVG